jgi:CxxC-x17-CxxC domain-containing protein
MEEDNRGSERRSPRDNRDRRGGGGRGGRGGGGFRPRRNFGPQEKHKATCSECGKECEVPFKPEEGRDVFCTDCFKKKRRY